MKRILIIYPHFPPSNLAGVHRARLFAQHLPSFGWRPIILTVHEDYYEEELDWNLHKLLPEDLRIEKVKAFTITSPRLIGDIGLRAFLQLNKKAKQLIKKEQIDFVYIPIPSFYCALLGRMLHRSTGINYGIDYIDPWVHEFPGSDKLFSRHWFTTKLAKWLEPIAVKKASLITGVAEGYYEPVFERNPFLRTQAVAGAMPYGGELRDHIIVNGLKLKPYLFDNKKDKTVLVYAGAMLPKAYSVLNAVFKSIQANPETFNQLEIHFIGTGKTPNDENGYNIKPMAEKYGLWHSVVFEYPKRIPYMDVLVHLNIADGIFIVGSTESHYTPSKTYQGILSEKPIFSILHKDSSAVTLLSEENLGGILTFNGEEDVQSIEEKFPVAFENFKYFLSDFNAEDVNKEIFNAYSARNVTSKLAALLDKALEKDLQIP